MVKAWVADVRPLYDRDRYEQYYAQLPDFRKQKADSLLRNESKAQSAGVWILWQKIRERYGLAADTPFNFSHSGTLVMCAACTDGRPVRVGCDVEKIGDLRLKLAERYFCREEYETIIREEKEERRTEMFYRYWVLKESFIKATGRGMALPLNSFSIRLGEPPVLRRQPEEYPCRYYYREFSVRDISYKMAVCSTDEEIDSEIHMGLRL